MKKGVERAVAILLLVICSGAAVGQPSQKLDERTRSNYTQMARSFEHDGRHEQAAAYYRLIVLDDPADILSYSGARRNYLQLNRLDEWQDLIQQLQSKRQDVRYRIDLADISYRRGQRNSARQQWQDILNDNSRNQSVYDLIAAALMENSLVEEAIGVYLRARKTFQQNHLYHFELAQLYTLQRDYGPAVREAVAFLAKNPRQFSYVESRLIDIIQKDGEAAVTIHRELERMAEAQPELRTDLLRIAATLYQQRRDYAEAVESYLQYLHFLPPGNRSQAAPLLLSLGEAAGNHGELAAAQKAYAAVIDSFGGSPFALRAQLGLARLLANQKLYGESIDALRDFARRFPQSREAVQALVDAGDLAFDHLFALDEARELYNEASRFSLQPPETIALHQRLGRCAIAAGDLRAAEKEFRSILDQPGQQENPLALLALAKISLYRGKPGHARQQLSQMVSAAQSNFDEPQINDAFEIMLLMQSARFDSSALSAWGMADFLLQQRKTGEARRWIRQQEGQNPQLREEWQRLLADAFLVEAKYDSARAVLGHLAASEGVYQEWALLQIGEVFQKTEQPREAEKIYEQFLLKFPASIYSEPIRNELRRIKEFRQ